MDMSFLGVRGGMFLLKEMCLGLKVTRDELMIVNLDSLLDWIEKCLGD
jgi:hypothetical protein